MNITPVNNISFAATTANISKNAQHETEKILNEGINNLNLSIKEALEQINIYNNKGNNYSQQIQELKERIKRLNENKQLLLKKLEKISNENKHDKNTIELKATDTLQQNISPKEIPSVKTRLFNRNSQKFYDNLYYLIYKR